jgi:hypothetical protein
VSAAGLDVGLRVMNQLLEGRRPSRDPELMGELLSHFEDPRAAWSHLKQIEDSDYTPREKAVLVMNASGGVSPERAASVLDLAERYKHMEHQTAIEERLDERDSYNKRAVPAREDHRQSRDDAFGLRYALELAMPTESDDAKSVQAWSDVLDGKDPYADLRQPDHVDDRSLDLRAAWDAASVSDTAETIARIDDVAQYSDEE